ncbi:hypothetical protein EDC04DRAFT_2847140 [Pisolithus marmoratus]|nr:hypothetical protein EDC04DRAFT_2847140 [Pisolithus marmoratus]
MIARLGQSFGLLILLQQRNGDYKSVAAENEIVISGLGTNITSKNIQTKESLGNPVTRYRLPFFSYRFRWFSC